MANPLEVGRLPTTENYVGALADLHKPGVLPALIERFPGQFDSMMDFMQLTGRKRSWDRVQMIHHETDWKWVTLGVNANVGDPGAGNPITFVVTAAEHTGPIGNTQSYARETDIVEFPSGAFGQILPGGITATPGANVITVEPWDTAVNIGALTAGDRIIVHTNAQPERGTTPDPRTPETRTHTFDFSNIAEKYTVSGNEAVNITWVETGPGEYRWYIEGERDTAMRFRLSVENMLLVGPGVSNNPLITAYGGATGLIPWLQANANGVNYTAGAFNLADFDTMIDALDANLAPREFTIWAGLPLHRDITDMLANLFDNGSIVYGAFNGKKELAISMQFSSFHRSGRSFHLKQYQHFTNPESMGATGHQYANMGLLIPEGMTTDSRTKKKIHMMECVYKQVGSYSREFEHWLTGSGGGIPTKTNDTDELNSHYRATWGLWPKRSSAFGIFEV